MRKGIGVGAALVVVLVTGGAVARADDWPVRFALGGGLDLEHLGRARGQFSPYGASTSSSPVMLGLGIHAVGELALGAGLWLGVALRAGKLAETPFQDEDRSHGYYLGEELGLTLRPDLFLIRVAAGPTYLDADWVFIGGDLDHEGTVSTWGLVVRAEAGVELGAERGSSLEIVAGLARFYLAGAEEPMDDWHLSFGLGRRF
jgi:hypothetical protein